MTRKTAQKLVDAATALLDSGGENALTLRAVGQAAGVSHNAPYKHFANRSALLGAVATADFDLLKNQFYAASVLNASPRQRLIAALKAIHSFSVRHPARYRLLFSGPELAPANESLKQAAFPAFLELLGIVEAFRSEEQLSAIPSTTIAGLLFASVHGLILLESSDRLHPEKGLADAASSIELLVDLISPVS